MVTDCKPNTISFSVNHWPAPSMPPPLRRRGGVIEVRVVAQSAAAAKTDFAVQPLDSKKTTVIPESMRDRSRTR